MIKASQGEMSSGLMIGVVIAVLVIIGLIVWSGSKKSEVPMNEADTVPVTTQTTTTTSGTMNGGAPTTTTTTIETTPVNPTLPQTGFGPDEE